jgi:hypothetical protein
MLEFKEYDKQNPHIWEAFKEFSLNAKQKGFSNYGSSGIFEIIRWNTNIQSRDLYKINNNYKPHYARKMMLEFPEFEGFFRVRELRIKR